MTLMNQATDELFDSFSRTFATPRPNKRKKLEALSKETIARRLDDFYADAASLRARHKLGLLASARLIHRFQRTLMAAGYSAELVRQVVLALLLSLLTGCSKVPARA